MNLYLLEQDVNDDYDTYDAIVVAAENEADAIKIKPQEFYNKQACIDRWALPEEIKCTLIGVASENIKAGVILASFNAG